MAFHFPENISLNLGGSGRGAASSDSFVLNSFVWPHAVVTPQQGVRRWLYPSLPLPSTESLSGTIGETGFFAEYTLAEGLHVLDIVLGTASFPSCGITTPAPGPAKHTTPIHKRKPSLYQKQSPCLCGPVGTLRFPTRMWADRQWAARQASDGNSHCHAHE